MDVDNGCLAASHSRRCSVVSSNDALCREPSKNCDVSRSAARLAVATTAFNNIAATTSGVVDHNSAHHNGQPQPNSSELSLLQPFSILLAPLLVYSLLFVVFCLAIYLCSSHLIVFPRTYAYELTSSNVPYLLMHSSSSHLFRSNATMASMVVRNQSTLPPSDFTSAKVKIQRSINFNFDAQTQSQYSPFKILAILPEENAPMITLALRDATSKWERSDKHDSPFNTQFITEKSKFKLNHSRKKKPSSRNGSSSSSVNVPWIRASEIPLLIDSEPATNDTERILTSVCSWIKFHQPALVLSFLDYERNFYVSLVAETARIPFVSMTQNYQKEIDSIDFLDLSVSLLALIVLEGNRRVLIFQT